MQEESTYASILGQALLEQAPLPDEPGGVAWTDAADGLGDSLYRLCVEFGVSFNRFRRTILAEVPHQSRRSGDSPGESGPQGWLADTEPHSELVILALELMREDSEL